MIDEILTRLVHDNWRVRESAEAELADLGELAVTRLRALEAGSPDPEIRTRARAALDQIAADAKAGTRPVTLRLRNAPARDAFRSLAVSGGFEPRLVPADLWERREARDLPPVTLEMRRRPFWEAYRALHGQSGIGLRPAGDGQWSLCPEGDPRLHEKYAVVSGSFLLVPEISWNLPAAPSSVLRGPAAPAPIPQPLDTSRAGPGLTLRVLVFAEPRLRLAGGFGAAAIQQASDDKGVRLNRPPAARGPGLAPPLLATPADGAWAFAAHLSAPSPDATVLAACKGSIRTSVALRHARLELADPLAARNTLLAAGELRAVVVELKQATQPPARYFLSLSLDLQGRALDRGALLCSLNHGGLKVLDPAGRPYACRVAGISGSAQRVGVTVELSDPNHPGGARLGAPAKLVWDAPVETRTVDMPFEFRDVPLP